MGSCHLLKTIDVFQEVVPTEILRGLIEEGERLTVILEP